MKRHLATRFTSWGLVLGLGLFLLHHSASAAASVKSVTLKDGKPSIMEGGKPIPLEENLELSSIITVITNGTYTVSEGEPRKLEEGDMLDREGMLTTAKGVVRPVIDHLRRQGGKMILFKDGKESALSGEYVLPNGTRVLPSGEVRLPNNQLKRLIDGQIVGLDGTIISPRDSVTLRDGKVFVQRDGSQFPLRPNQTMMMNDGSKVFSDGRVVRRNGEVVQLTDGQILELTGPKTQ